MKVVKINGYITIPLIEGRTNEECYALIQTDLQAGGMCFFNGDIEIVEIEEEKKCTR